jgi:hypothetical protein
VAATEDLAVGQRAVLLLVDDFGASVSTVGVAEGCRLIPRVPIEIGPVDCARGVGAGPAAEPGGVVAGAVVMEAGLIVALLAGVAVALAADGQPAKPSSFLRG